MEVDIPYLDVFSEHDDYVDADLLSDELLAGYRRKEFKAHIRNYKPSYSKLALLDLFRSTVPDEIDGMSIDFDYYTADYITLGSENYLIIVSDVFDYLEVPESSFKFTEENESILEDETPFTAGNLISFFKGEVYNTTSMTPRGIIWRIINNNLVPSELYERKTGKAIFPDLDYLSKIGDKKSDGSWVLSKFIVDYYLPLEGGIYKINIYTKGYDVLRPEGSWTKKRDGVIVEYSVPLVGVLDRMETIGIYDRCVKRGFFPAILGGRSIDSDYYKRYSDISEVDYSIVNRILTGKGDIGYVINWISTSEFDTPPIGIPPIDGTPGVPGIPGCGDFTIPKLPVTLFQINVVVIIILLIFDKEDPEDRRYIKWALGALGVYGIYSVI